MNYLNRFSRLNFLKEAATKAKDLEDLRRIFVNKYPGDQRAAGLSIQYYKKFIKKSDPNVFLTEENLPQTLPVSVEELLKIIQSQKATESKSEKYDLINKLKEENSSVDFSGLEEEQIRWLYSRYIEKKTEEGEVLHRIEDAIVTLENFAPIYSAYKTSDELRKKLEEKGIKDIPPLENLTAEDMERIIAAESSDLSVRVHGVEIKPEEFLGKFGKWNLWLPHTKETSVKIAGYDESFNPKTTWCTARTRGSNLFYNYIGRKDIPSFLFYIIKDNPRDSNDWLSLGYISHGNILKPDFSGRSGGLSVNRDNKGLKEGDYSRVLGEEWSPIKSKIESELQKYKVIDGGSEKYISPARSIIKELAKDVSKFRKEFYQKSVKEKEDFCNVILDSNPSDNVLKEIYSFKARTESIDFLDRYSGEPLAMPYLKLAAEQVAKKNPSFFLKNLSDKSWAQDYIGLASEGVKEKAKKEPFEFLSYNAYEFWAQPYLDLASEGAEELATKNPSILLDYLSDKPWAQDYIKLAAEEYIKKDPYSFIDQFSNKPWAQPYVKLIAEGYAKEYPYYFLHSHSNKPWAQDYIGLAAEGCAKEDPERFITIFSYKPWAQDYIGLAAEKLAKKNPDRFITEYSDEPWAQDFLKLAAEGCAKQNPVYFLDKFSDKPWAQDYLKIAAEGCAKQVPNYFLKNLSDKPWAQDYIGLASEGAKELAKKEPFEFLDYNAHESWAQPYLDLASEGAEKLARENPSILLDYLSDKPWAQPYIDLAAEIYTKKNPDRFLRVYSDKPLAQPYLKLAAETLVKEQPDYLLRYYLDKPWAQPYIKLAAEGCAKKNPYYLLQQHSDKPWAQDYIKLAVEEYIKKEPDDFIAQFLDKPWAKPYIDKIRNNQQEPKTASDMVSKKILKLSYVLNKIGCFEHAKTIKTFLE